MNPSDTPTTAANNRSAIMNFSSMPPEALRSMIDDLGLCMSVSDLTFCQQYFANRERRFPTVEEIRMLDAVIRIRRTNAESYRLTRVNATESAIFATYTDLLQKFYADGPQNALPITLSEATQVATRYLARIGTGRSLADEEALAAEQTPSSLPAESAILLLLPLMRTVRTEDATRQFLADPEARALITRTLPVGEYGIAMTLAECTQGVFADLRRLVSADEPTPSLPSLITALHGATLLVSDRGHVDTLAARAAIYGLRAVYFAKATDTGHFVLAQQGNPYLNMELGFLRALKNGTEDANVYLPPLSPLFSRTMDDALLSTLLATAMGNRREEGLLEVAYTLSRRASSPEALGCALASVLGVYRVQIELCITSRTRIRYTEAVELPACEISLGELSHRLPDQGTAAGQSIHWLSLSHTPDTLPDFAAVRTLCDELTKLSREGKLVAVRAVKGSLASAMKAMGATVSETPTEDAAFGLLLCATEALPYPLVGTVTAAEPTVSSPLSETSQENGALL